MSGVRVEPWERFGVCQGCKANNVVLERVWPGVERWRCRECAPWERADHLLYMRVKGDVL